jgi:hypothetical protein
MIDNGFAGLVHGPGGGLVRTGGFGSALAGLFVVWTNFDFGLASFQFNI